MPPDVEERIQQIEVRYATLEAMHKQSIEAHNAFMAEQRRRDELRDEQDARRDELQKRLIVGICGDVEGGKPGLQTRVHDLELSEAKRAAWESRLLLGILSLNATGIVALVIFLAKMYFKA